MLQVSWPSPDGLHCPALFLKRPLNSLQSSAARDAFNINFPAIVRPTLPQFLRPVQGPLFYSILDTQGLILKAVTPSNFIQMFPALITLMSLPCSEQTLDISPSACQLAKKISAWCRLFYPLVQTIFCVIKILLSCKTMMWPMKL